MTAVTCSICTTTDPNPPVKRIQVDMPTGWATVTIAERGEVRRNFRLCAVCTTAVRAQLHQLQARHVDSPVVR